MLPIRTWRVRPSVRYTGLAGTWVDSPSRLAAIAPEGATRLPVCRASASAISSEVGAERDAQPLVHPGIVVETSPEPLNLAALDQPGERLVGGIAAAQIEKVLRCEDLSPVLPANPVQNVVLYGAHRLLLSCQKSVHDFLTNGKAGKARPIGKTTGGERVRKNRIKPGPSKKEKRGRGKTAGKPDIANIDNCPGPARSSKLVCAGRPAIRLERRPVGVGSGNLVESVPCGRSESPDRPSPARAGRSAGVAVRPDGREFAVAAAVGGARTWWGHRPRLRKRGRPVDRHHVPRFPSDLTGSWFFLPGPIR